MWSCVFISLKNILILGLWNFIFIIILSRTKISTDCKINYVVEFRQLCIVLMYSRYIQQNSTKCNQIQQYTSLTGWENVTWCSAYHLYLNSLKKVLTHILWRFQIEILLAVGQRFVMVKTSCIGPGLK